MSNRVLQVLNIFICYLIPVQLRFISLGNSNRLSALCD